MNNWILYRHNWKNKVAIGTYDNEQLISRISAPAFYQAAESYAELWSKINPMEYPIQELKNQICQHFLEDGYAIPITHQNGVVTFILREGNQVFLVSE